LVQELARQGISIYRKYAPSLPRVNVDYAQIHQALWGLLWKMAKEIPPGGKLRVRLEANHESAAFPGVTLSISCAGQIFSPAQLRRIFSPLADLKSQASGLSLAFARQIIEQHGGRLLVESQADQGTIFTLHLPGLSSNSSG
jgi:signal transduction histidine kinase